MITRINMDLEDEKLMKSFRELVNDLHDGKFKQFYRYEVTQAFKLYLAAHHREDYPKIVENDKSLKYLIIPQLLHTQSSRSFDKRHVDFLIKFFKTYLTMTQKEVSKSEIIGFIKSSLLIKDKRAVDGWIVFLNEIGWVIFHLGKPVINLKEKSLFDLLGEDPTGTYQPYKNDILKSNSILKANPVLNEDSRARIRWLKMVSPIAKAIHRPCPKCGVLVILVLEY